MDACRITPTGLRSRALLGLALVALVSQAPGLLTAGEVPFSNLSQVHLGGFNGALALRSGDLDGDGDLDLVGASVLDSETRWFENTEGDASLWTSHCIDTAFPGAFALEVADVDADGDLDVVGGSITTGVVAWWEQTGAGGCGWSENAVNVFLGDTCHALTLDHTGAGSDPVADPPSSSGCGAGQYRANDLLNLSAAPDPGWVVSGWSGSDSDGAGSITSLTMSDGPATVTVHDEEALFMDGFESGDTSAWSSTVP